MTTIAIAPDSKSLVLQSGVNSDDFPLEKQQNVQVWDLEKKAQKFSRGSTTNGPVAFSPDGKLIAYSARSSSVITNDGIHLLNATTGAKVRQLTTEGGGGIDLGIQFSPSSDLLVAAFQKHSADTRLVGWNPGTGEVQLDLKISDKDGSAISRLFSKGQRIVSAEGPVLKIWNVKEKKADREWRFPEDGKVTTIAASEDGKRVAANGQGKTICVWDNETGKLLRTIETRAGSLNSPTDDSQILFTPSGKTLVYTKKDRRIFLEDVSTGELRAILTWSAQDKPESSRFGLLEQIWGLDISPDGRVLVAAHDKEFAVWDLPDKL